MLFQPITPNARLFLGFLLAVFGMAVSARAQDIAWPQALHHAMQRAGNVEWRIRLAAGQTCPTMAAGTGIVLDSLDAYDKADQPMVRQVLDLGDYVQVAAVATGSPADLAGIMPGDEILEVNGTNPDLLPLPSIDETLQDNKKVDVSTKALRLGVALSGLSTQMPAHFKVRRNGSETVVQFKPEAICSSRVFISTKNNLQAYTDGANIVLTARLVDFTVSDDELAILIGHELGHVIGRDGKASGINGSRRMEDRADLLGADLAMCAGYNVKIAAPFWRRYEKTFWVRFIAIRGASSGQDRVRNVHSRLAPQTCPIIKIPPIAQ